MRVAVLGPAGSLGSHISIELLNRGHHVVGISRAPEKLGVHNCYEPIKLDIHSATADQLVEVLKDVEVIVSAYSTPRGPGAYKAYLEPAVRVLKAAKFLSQGKKNFYFVMVGGTGSLRLPGERFTTAPETKDWWLAFRHTLGDSEVATEQAVGWVGGAGPVADAMRAYRTARLALKAGTATDKDWQAMKAMEDPILQGKDPVKDIPLAARTTFQMFEGDTSFRWTFVSPPAKFRPGLKTGRYELRNDELPLSSHQGLNAEPRDWDQIEASLLGISYPDLALALADEVEKQEKVGVHWSVVGELTDDVVREIGVKL